MMSRLSHHQAVIMIGACGFGVLSRMTPVLLPGAMTSEVAALARAEFSVQANILRAADLDYPGTAIELRIDRTEMGRGPLTVFHVSNQAESHGRELLVGDDGARVYALGGFQAPELVAAARAVRVVLGSSPSADREAMLFLMRLADPNGGDVQLVDSLAYFRGEPGFGREGPGPGVCAVGISVRPGWAGAQEKARLCVVLVPSGEVASWARRVLR